MWEKKSNRGWKKKTEGTSDVLGPQLGAVQRHLDALFQLQQDVVQVLATLLMLRLWLRLLRLLRLRLRLLLLLLLLLAKGIRSRGKRTMTE